MSGLTLRRLHFDRLWLLKLAILLLGVFLLWTFIPSLAW